MKLALFRETRQISKIGNYSLHSCNNLKLFAFITEHGPSGLSNSENYFLDYFLKNVSKILVFFDFMPKTFLNISLHSLLSYMNVHHININSNTCSDRHLPTYIQFSTQNYPFYFFSLIFISWRLITIL